MDRIDIINKLIDKYGYTDYLEIGVQNGISFRGVKAITKIGVDPDLNSRATHHVTSDEFFEQNKRKFDIIFIDGMHVAEYVERDILNALKILNPNGIIVCHDCLPFDEDSQRVPRMTKRWVGDCWKTFAKFRFERSDLEMRTVNTDCGVGLIRRGQQVTFNRLVSEYSEFEKEVIEILNLISEQEFCKIYL